MSSRVGALKRLPRISFRRRGTRVRSAFKECTNFAPHYDSKDGLLLRCCTVISIRLNTGEFFLGLPVTHLKHMGINTSPTAWHTAGYNYTTLHFAVKLTRKKHPNTSQDYDKPQATLGMQQGPQLMIKFQAVPNMSTGILPAGCKVQHKCRKVQLP